MLSPLAQFSDQNYKFVYNKTKIINCILRNVYKQYEVSFSTANVLAVYNVWSKLTSSNNSLKLTSPFPLLTVPSADIHDELEIGLSTEDSKYGKMTSRGCFTTIKFQSTL